MQRRPRSPTVKPEQRFLALKIVTLHSKRRFLLGVVYRGSLWLDGIIFTPVGRRRAKGVADIVKESHYFKELRYVLLTLPMEEPLDGASLSKALSMPVIVLGRSRLRSWGIEKNVAERILHVFKPKGGEPEALRLAGLLKRELEVGLEKALSERRHHSIRG